MESRCDCLILSVFLSMIKSMVGDVLRRRTNADVSQHSDV